MVKMVFTIDLGPIPRAPLELAKPMIEKQLKDAMGKQFATSGMNPKDIKLEMKD